MKVLLVAAIAACIAGCSEAIADHSRLGKPLGEYMTIEGVPVPEERTEREWMLEVDTIDGRHLAAPVVSAVRGMERPVGATRCILRGYEWGAMEGVPVDPENPVAVTTKAIGFYNWFQVTKVLTGEKPAS